MKKKFLTSIAITLVAVLAITSLTVALWKGDESVQTGGSTPLMEKLKSKGYKGTPEQLITSITGENGEKGEAGKSAYELAVENGYTGTLQEWLISLVGADGKDGADGRDGKSAYELAVENGYSGTEAEWLTTLVGPKGDTGEAGKTPYVKDGNWWIDGTDTGVKAQGADGVSVIDSYVDDHLHLWIVLSSGTKIDAGYVGVSTSDPETTYTVVFKDDDGTILKTESVEKGKSATAPTEPSKEGFIFTGWSVPFDNVSSNLTVIAQYKEITAPTLMVKNVEAHPDESVQIPVIIANNPGIAGATIKLTYDTRLTLTNASSGEAFETLDYTAPYKLTSPCNFNWDSLSGMAANDGTILLLTFHVPNNVNPGDQLDVSCSYTNGDIFDANLDDVTIQMIGGAITIK